VGVVADVLDSALDQTPTPAVFVPVDQFTAGSWVTYVLRTPKPTPALASAVEREVQAVSRQASVPNGSLMRDRLMRSIRDRSFATMIVVLFAAAAVGVSAAGLVGVVGATVARRTREIAIRMAVGAQAGDVRRLVTREVVAATSLGAAVGLMAGGWVSTTMESLLFGVSPADPIALALATVLLMAAVVAAAWVPARRATRLSPTVALRVE
jgi:ABC-type antimicrobial peptide transport system permease subunit